MANPIQILAVDDDPNMHRLIELYLASRVFSVTAVSTARMALHKLDTLNFDLVISDIQMPQMDGIALTKEIRLRNNDIPIIIVSAFGGTSMIKQAHTAGANLVIEKPFEQEHLIEKIDTLLAEKS